MVCITITLHIHITFIFAQSHTEAKRTQSPHHAPRLLHTPRPSSAMKMRTKLVTWNGMCQRVERLYQEQNDNSSSKMTHTMIIAHSNRSGTLSSFSVGIGNTHTHTQFKMMDTSEHNFCFSIESIFKACNFYSGIHHSHILYIRKKWGVFLHDNMDFFFLCIWCAVCAWRCCGSALPFTWYGSYVAGGEWMNEWMLAATAAVLLLFCFSVWVGQRWRSATENVFQRTLYPFHQLAILSTYIFVVLSLIVCCVFFFLYLSLCLTVSPSLSLSCLYSYSVLPSILIWRE